MYYIYVCVYQYENLYITLTYLILALCSYLCNALPHNAKIKTFIKDMEPIMELGPDALIMADPGLILMVRETPLSLVHLENFTAATRAGATLMPLAPGWYHGPEDFEALARSVVDRALDHLGLPELVSRRWTGDEAE